VYPAAVTGQRVSHGRSTSYYLTLSPWGPMTGAFETSVGRRLYNAVNLGDTVEVSLHSGWLHIPWYQVTPRHANP
jgi:hypothetical protein